MGARSNKTIASHPYRPAAILQFALFLAFHAVRILGAEVGTSSTSTLNIIWFGFFMLLIN